MSFWKPITYRNCYWYKNTNSRSCRSNKKIPTLASHPCGSYDYDIPSPSLGQPCLVQRVILGLIYVFLTVQFIYALLRFYFSTRRGNLTSFQITNSTNNVCLFNSEAIRLHQPFSPLPMLHSWNTLIFLKDCYWYSWNLDWTFFLFMWLMLIIRSTNRGRWCELHGIHERVSLKQL